MTQHRTGNSTVPDGATGRRAESSPHMPSSGSTPVGSTRADSSPHMPGSTRGENPFPPKDDEEAKSKRAADSALGPNQGMPGGN